jgi:hypothetical protein
MNLGGPARCVYRGTWEGKALGTAGCQSESGPMGPRRARSFQAIGLDSL